MTCNNIDIVEIKVVKDYILFLRFEDGKSGEINIAELIPFKGIFEPLQDKTYFATVTIDNETSTICWKNGADISPSLLYEKIR